MDPAFGSVPVGEVDALASFPSLTCESHCSRRASSLHCFSFADDRFPLFFFASRAAAAAADASTWPISPGRPVYLSPGRREQKP